jgi:hypothetical protein
LKLVDHARRHIGLFWLQWWGRKGKLRLIHFQFAIDDWGNRTSAMQPVIITRSRILVERYRWSLSAVSSMGPEQVRLYSKDYGFKWSLSNINEPFTR